MKQRISKQKQSSAVIYIKHHTKHRDHEKRSKNRLETCSSQLCFLEEMMEETANEANEERKHRTSRTYTNGLVI